MKRFFTLVFSIAISTGAVQVLAAGGDVKAGKAKSGLCSGCHGPDGNSSNPLWPTLAGQDEDYLAKQLADFKSGERKDPVMSGFAAALTKKDMRDLAAYFAAQEIKEDVASDVTMAKLGEKIYRGGNAKTGVSACMSCHGPSGLGIPPRFPRVSGQHGAYAVKQLLDFKSGKRVNDGEVMRLIAFRMSESEIKAVSEYMAGLR